MNWLKISFFARSNYISIASWERKKMEWYSKHLRIIKFVLVDGFSIDLSLYLIGEYFSFSFSYWISKNIFIKFFFVCAKVDVCQNGNKDGKSISIVAQTISSNSSMRDFRIVHNFKVNAEMKFSVWFILLRMNIVFIEHGKTLPARKWNRKSSAHWFWW